MKRASTKTQTMIGAGERVACTLRTLALLLSLPAAVAQADALGDLPDPTRPYRAAVAAARTDGGGLLQSTLVSPSRRWAVIDGAARRIGDRVGDRVIVAIGPYEVVLRDARGGMHRLRLGPRIKDRAPQDLHVELTPNHNNKLP